MDCARARRAAYFMIYGTLKFITPYLIESRQTALPDSPLRERPRAFAGIVATVARGVVSAKLRPRDTEHRAWDRSRADAWAAEGAVSVLAFEILAPNNRLTAAVSEECTMPHSRDDA